MGGCLVPFPGRGARVSQKSPLCLEGTPGGVTQSNLPLKVNKFGVSCVGFI